MRTSPPLPDPPSPRERSCAPTAGPACAVALLAAALAACSDASSVEHPRGETASLVRICREARETRPADRSVVEVGGFRLLEENRSECPWEAVGPQPGIQTLVRPPGGSEDRSDFLPAIALRNEGPKSFTHRFDYSARGVTTVEVDLTLYGATEERVRVVTLDVDGEVADTTEWRTLLCRPDPYHLKFHILGDESVESARTGVRVEIEGLEKHAALIAMFAFRTPPASLYPALGVDELVEVGREWRLAAGLVEGSPWETELSSLAGASARVSFAVHMSANEKHRVDSARLAVRLRGGANELDRTLTIPTDALERWAPLAVDLPGPLAVGQRLELEVIDDDPARTSVVLLGDAVVTRGRESPHRVILVTSDTHRADHLSAADSSAFVDTPVLDRLGRRGAFFTNCQSTTNVTNPSHIAMLSGIHPRDTRIVDNKTPLSERATTLAEVFRDAGYRTFAAISTQHLDPYQSGLGQGFDRFEAPSTFKRSGNVAVDIVREWLQDETGMPAFLWLHVFDAHAPYAPPDPYRARATKDLAQDAGAGLGLADTYVPTWIKDAGLSNPDYVEALYRGEVDWIDESLRALLESPELQGSTVVFTSDHGESLRTHSIFWDHTGLYLPMVEVPLIIVDPRVPALRSDAPVQQIDVARTLIELSGIDVDFPGRNLVRLAEEGAPDEPRFALAAHGLQASVSSGKWFLVMDLQDLSEEFVLHRWSHGRTQLFDRTDGVDTERDLADEHPDVEQRLREALIAFLANASVEGLNVDREIDAAAAANLEALGYAAFESTTPSAWYTPKEGGRDDPSTD